MTTDLAIRRLEVRTRKAELTASVQREAIVTTREILIQLLSNPATGMVLSVAMIELLQKWGLLSQFLGSTLEGVIMTPTVINALSGALSGIKEGVGDVAGIAQLLALK